MKKRIEICHGDEYRTKLSSIYDQEDFFYEAYCKAAQGVRDIVQATKNYYRKSYYRPERENAQRRSWEQEPDGVTEYMRLASYPNNFVAFCAGRGQGKTSAMVSFSSSLRSMRGTSQERNFWKKEITDNSFYVLDPIDPTMMDKEDSILCVIISRMFECYAQAQDRPCAQRSAHIEKEPDLLKRFRKCYRNLDVLQKGRQLQDCYDDLEYLADLGDSSNMKRAFHELVTLFLQLMFSREEGSIQQFLVVQIDDADLNASNAYRIVEELRKYCVVPNVIILMASDFEQLELTVEQYFVGEFEPLHKSKGKGNTEILSHCHKMMERYLDKLIPGARQIHLPKIDDYIRAQKNELLLRYVESGQEDCGDGEQAPPAEDYQDFLLKLIYQKTRLILVKPEGYLHNLLPKTMRELTHLLAFLDALEPISEKEGVFSKVIGAWQDKRKSSPNESELTRPSPAYMDALTLRRENINAFMGYLRHCWVKAALNERQQAAVIPAMEAITDLKIKQLFIKLNEYGADKYQDWGFVRECPNPQYTDVVETLNKLKHQPASTEDFGVIYISATILTLCMHLLAIQDLEQGLKFEQLTRFMGDGVFLPDMARFTYKGLRYDQLKITYDLISAAEPTVSGRLERASLNTRIAALLLLSPGGPIDQNARKVPDIPFQSNKPGNQLSFLQLFKNCLTRTASQLDASSTTEVLDIVLSWDLQYRISKRIKEENQKLVSGAGWFQFETWIGNCIGIIDEAYQAGLNALDIQTTAASLKKTLADESVRKYLAALAMGNPTYAAGWWRAAKARLQSELGKAYGVLKNMGDHSGIPSDQSEDSAWHTVRIFNSLILCMETLSNLDKIDLLAFTDNLLAFGPLYQNGVTPQSVIDEAAQIVPAFQPANKELEDKLLAMAGNADELCRKVKDCQATLQGIELSYFTPAPTARKTAPILQGIERGHFTPVPTARKTSPTLQGIELSYFTPATAARKTSPTKSWKTIATPKAVPAKPSETATPRRSIRKAQFRSKRPAALGRFRKASTAKR